jgi:hypothetical protein
MMNAAAAIAILRIGLRIRDSMALLVGTGSRAGAAPVTGRRVRRRMRRSYSGVSEVNKTGDKKFEIQRF